MATLLKICGFQIPGRRGGGSTSHFDHGGSIVRDINGNPTQPSIAMVRDDDYLADSKSNATWVDGSAGIDPDSDLMADGTHPNSSGYVRLASQLVPAVEALL